MPTKCSVSGCENFYSKGVPFFDVPSPLKYKFCSVKAELSKKRRKLWLDAMGITKDLSNILRICSKHFVTGKPATLEDSKDVDWVPTLHMKGSSSTHKRRRKDKESGENRRDSGSSHSHSSKESFTTSERKRSSRNSEKNARPEDKIVKNESRKSHKKIDVKKFLNCKVLLDGNIQCTTFKGTNGSGLTIAQKHGNFTSDNVTVRETAINNTVLRIHLIREDLHDLKKKSETANNNSPSRKKRKELKVSSFGRQIKRKSNYFEDSFIHTPWKKSVNARTVESVKVPGSEKAERQIKNQSMKEEKEFSIDSKLESNRELVKDVPDNTKTLNRTIKKHYRDKIKIKLFPKTSTAIKNSVKNGRVDPELEESMKLHREILFVKNLKPEPQWRGMNKTYFLKFCPYRYPDDGTLDYSFQKLVTDVKNMKLPAPSWKIKVVIRQGKISAVTFTNKLTPERCVGFFANSDKYKITIDNRPALLLGSPDHVQTSEDLEILLDIIQNIDSENPMVFYK